MSEDAHLDVRHQVGGVCDAIVDLHAEPNVGRSHAFSLRRFADSTVRRRRASSGPQPVLADCLKLLSPIAADPDGRFAGSQEAPE